ncbi:MAG: phage tail protein [Oxalobacter sp.]|nr:MAG: phage tail protein [Oxalobacter sp.]
MADNITFFTIPTDWRVPGAFIEVDHTKAVQGLPTMPQKILLIGQRLATGAVGAEVLTRVTREGQGGAYFGRGAMLAQMCDASLRANKYTETWALALDDLAAGVKATGTVTFTGEAGESATLNFYIGGVKVPVGIGVSDTAATVAAAFVAAVNANTDLAVTAAAVAGVVTLTANHNGLEGNKIDVRLGYYREDTQVVNGMLCAIVKMANGAGNPDVLDAIAAMATGSFYTIVSGLSDAANLTALETELASRWGGMDMRTGHVFSAKYGSFAELGDFGAARNSPHSTLPGINGCPNLPWVYAAQYAAGIQFSGANDPAIPFRGIVLPDILAPLEADRFTDVERNLLLHDGISTCTVDDGGKVMVEQVVTTYQTNSFGLEDRSLLKLNTKWTVDYMRYAFRVAVVTDYPNHKLAGDDVLSRIQPGQRIATPRLIRNTLIATASKLVEVGLLEDLEQFKKELQVVRSTADENRVNAIIPPNIVNQFDVFAAAVQYIL